MKKCSQDRWMDSGIEKCAKQVMRIRTLGEKETYKYLAILEADTLKQVEMKEKIRKNILGEPERYSRQNYQAEIFSKE